LDFSCTKAQLFRTILSGILAVPFMKLILASASPRRAEILRDAGVSFSVMSSAIDETPYPNENPSALVERLANAKADLVAARALGPAIVVAADTVVVLDGHVLGKPRSREEGGHMLEQLSGRTHSVLTGVSLIRLPDAVRRQFVESTLVQFAAISKEEIARYLTTEESHDKAGAYGIQGRAGRYIPRIEGCYFNVVGLPLSRLLASLEELGWSEQALS
jgi:septum formation protein